MKVLLTATVQSHICQFHRPLVELLHENECEVHVAARDNLAEKNGLKLDFVDKIYDVPFSRSPKSIDNVKAYKLLKKIIDEENYDVVHCNTPMGGIVTRLASRKAQKKGAKVYYTAHGFHFYKGACKKNWLIYYPIEKMFSRLTDKLITITEEDYKLARDKFHCNVKHIHGVGVNTSKFDLITLEQCEKFREKQGWNDKFLILCIGELNENKNQTSLIRAISKVIIDMPNTLLLLAGNGPKEEELRHLIEEKCLEKHVLLLGYRTDIEWFIQACDLVVSVSLREGLPVNILEAMYCKKAVIVSDNRGHRELIVNKKNGYLVNAKDVQQIANSIKYLINSTNIRVQMEKNTKEKVKLYTDKSVKEELKKIYFD